MARKPAAALRYASEDYVFESREEAIGFLADFRNYGEIVRIMGGKHVTYVCRERRNGGLKQIVVSSGAEEEVDAGSVDELMAVGEHKAVDRRRRNWRQGGRLIL